MNLMTIRSRRKTVNHGEYDDKQGVRTLQSNTQLKSLTCNHHAMQTIHLIGSISNGNIFHAPYECSTMLMSCVLCGHVMALMHILGKDMHLAYMSV